jgi:hypothetical protein
LLLTHCRLRVLGGDLHLHLAVGGRLTDRAAAVGLGDFHLGLVDGLGRRLAPQRLDVAGLVGDVTDVHVDQLEADFVHLRADVLVDQIEKLFAVLVDLLDRQRGDDQSRLSKDDVARLGGDLLVGEAEQALGRVVHDVRVRRDADGERRGDVNADVLLGQRAGQLDLDRHRLQVEVGVALQQRDDERAAAVQALGRALALDLSVNDENAVGWTPAVLPDQHRHEEQRQQDRHDDQRHRTEIERGHGHRRGDGSDEHREPPFFSLG